MKTALLYLLTPLLTFSLGVNIYNFLSPWTTEVAAPVVEVTTRVISADPQVPADVPVGLPPPLPDPRLILDDASKISGTNAVFFILGPRPREFADFASIEVTLSDHDASNFISLYENSGDTHQQYPASFAFVSNRKLFVVTSTEAESGFEYRFDGEFLRTDFPNIAGKKIAALRGTLTKIKNGQKVAEAVVKFRMDHFGC